MWQFAEAVKGIGEACRALGVPITGGNVSLYNETDGRPIYPTPVIGVVGLLEHADRVLERRFKETGDIVILLGEGRGELGGSEYLKTMHGLVRGTPPALDLEAERALQDLLVGLAERPSHPIGSRLLRRRVCGDTGGVLFRDRRGRGGSVDRCGRGRRRRTGQRRGGALRRIGVARRRLDTGMRT